MIVFAKNMNTELARTRKFPLFATEPFPHERVGSGDKTKAASVSAYIDILYTSSNNRLVDKHTFCDKMAASTFLFTLIFASRALSYSKFFSCWIY